MFEPKLHALALRKAGLTRPIRVLLALAILICLCLGLIYAAIVLHAVQERNQPHVHTRQQS